jgi:hypothetical protein
MLLRFTCASAHLCSAFHNMAQSAFTHVLSAAGGVLMGAALAKAVAPQAYFDCHGSVAIPWLVVFNWPQIPLRVQTHVGVALGAVFVGYNFMRHSRFCA